MSEAYFFEIVLALIASIIALLAYIWKGHLDQHKEINAVLAELAKTKTLCYGTFATKVEMENVKEDMHSKDLTIAALRGEVSTMAKLLKSGGVVHDQ